MADKIKKFFQKKKMEARFKRAGPGRKLTDDTSSHSGNEPTDHHTPSPRTAMSDEARQAAAAAMARLSMNKRPDQAAFNTSLAAIQSQVRREIEAEKKLSQQAAPKEEATTTVQMDASPLLAVQGVYFRCPLISNEILSKNEWQEKIRTFLYETLESEPGLTACLIIHSCNKSRDKVSQCVETLCKYLENIINNPGEDKYRRIRLSNRVFQEKVAPLEGTMEFLSAAGFKKEKVKVNEVEEDFLVYSDDSEEMKENLNMLFDAIKTAEPVQLDLDRNLRVLYPSQAAKQVELPPVFFTITPEEIKREQQLKAEGVERITMLRTKAMRERDEQREMRKYRFALIRIRFPDGILLQGTFSVHEKVVAVFDFVAENLEEESLDFSLVTPTGQRLTDQDKEKSLVDLRLVPATILIFIADGTGTSQQSSKMYLKPEVTLLVQPIE